MQYIVLVIKKIVMSICMLYTFDLIVMSVGVIIPINFTTICLVSLLGLPAIFAILIIQEMI